MNVTPSSRSSAAAAFGPVGLALIGVAVLWVAMSFTYPFGWDQGILAWAGGIVLRGGLPFRDAWDMKGPVVYYVFAGAQALFGAHLWGIRVVDTVLALIAARSIARTVTPLTDDTTGRWSALFFFLWYASHSYWHTAQPDGWVAMLAAVILLPLLTSARRLRRLVLAGAAVGVMTLVKPVYAAFMLLPVLSVVAGEPGALVPVAAAVTAGWLIPLGLTAAWFGAHGALDDLVAIYIRYPATAYNEMGQVSLADRARGVIEYLFTAPVVAVSLPVMAFGLAGLWRSHRQAAIVLGGWLVTAAALVTLQGRFFAYHWLPVLPAAVVAGAVGLYGVLPKARLLAVAIMTVALLQCVVPIAWEELRFVSWLAGRTSTAAYYDAYGDAGNDMRAVEWLDTQGAPGKVYLFGWNSSVPWLSRRDTVSRFGFSMPLLIGVGGPTLAGYRDELMRALHDDPPAYVILGTQSRLILRRPTSLDEFPALAELIRRDYVKVAEFGVLQIHERVGLRAGRR